MFSSVSNPFASGNYSGRPESWGSRGGGGSGTMYVNPAALAASSPIADIILSNATARALENCAKSFEVSGVLLASEEVVVQETIGQGAYAVVYRGRYRNKDVAVKELNMRDWGNSPEAIQDFRTEVALMKAMHHPNVLELIGACTAPTLRLVSEFCHRGNLFDLLATDRAMSRVRGTPSQLSWALRLHLALDEARGMYFLHTAFPTPLIHRDLKSLNLLISKGWTLKVSDFGLSRFRNLSLQTRLTGACGTYQWMAP